MANTAASHTAESLATMPASLEQNARALVERLLAVPLPPENGEIVIRDVEFRTKHGLLRAESLLTATQAQTQDVFGYVWHEYDFDEPHAREFQVEWMEENFPGMRAKIADRLPTGATVLDAGCGAAWSAMAFFGHNLKRLGYVGIDVSVAVDRARKYFTDAGLPPAFLQVPIEAMPFGDATFDFIFTPGVLMHTDSVERSLGQLTRLLRPGGQILFWVYRRQPPLRDFADRHVCNHLAAMNDQEAYDALLPLTKFGESLGRAKMTINVPENIPFFGIPKGDYDLQRFFYYYIFKAFYNEHLSLKRANLQNFDWYRPLNAHKSSVEEVRAYCRNNRLRIDFEQQSNSGISVIATKM